MTKDRVVKLEDSPITYFLEAAATSIGVGMVLGGFVAGGLGMVRGKSRAELEFQALQAGYASGALCLGLRVAEMTASI
jgi:hypothetical protein